MKSNDAASNRNLDGLRCLKRQEPRNRRRDFDRDNQLGFIGNAAIAESLSGSGSGFRTLKQSLGLRFLSAFRWTCWTLRIIFRLVLETAWLIFSAKGGGEGKSRSSSSATKWPSLARA